MLIKNNSFWLSLFLHFTLFLVISIKFIFYPVAETKIEKSIIQIYQAPTLIKPKKSVIAKSSPSQHSHAEKQKPPDKNILKILHDTIAEKITYPENAHSSNEIRTVKIGLRVYPTGRITDVALLVTSGDKMIDAAALAAAQSITFIQEAQLYLKVPEFFAVDIRFFP